MLTKAQIFNFLFTWLKTESGQTVIMANQKGPRPPRPYVALKFLNGSQRLGASIDQSSMTHSVDEDDNDVYTVSTEGMRMAIASIDFFGENALDTAAKVRDSLDRPDVVFDFGKIGISHLDDSGITDLTKLEETILEERAQMDLTIGYVSSSEVDVSTIEEVQFSGNVNDREIPTITVTDT